MRVGLFRWGLIITSFLLGATAQAETVRSDNTNCRAAPRATSPVLGTLRRGEEFAVISASDGWSYVDPLSLPACWVRSDLIARDVSGWTSSSIGGRDLSGDTISRRSAPAKLMGKSSATPKARPSSSRTRSRSNGLQGGGSCPCGGGSVCVGPRGGRYCITSGGNKRYGV